MPVRCNGTIMCLFVSNTWTIHTFTRLPGTIGSNQCAKKFNVAQFLSEVGKYILLFNGDYRGGLNSVKRKKDDSASSRYLSRRKRM